MIIRRDISLTYCHQVLFTQGVFDPVNDTLAGVLEGSGTENVKVLVFVDDQLDLGDSVETYFQERSGLTLVASPISLPGGEAAKNDWSLVEFVWQCTIINFVGTLTSSLSVVGPFKTWSDLPLRPRIAASVMCACLRPR